MYEMIIVRLLMCSTPKLKTKVKGKVQTATIGILSSMSSKQRQLFAARANAANLRQAEKTIYDKAKSKRIERLNSSKINLYKKINKNKYKKTWLYWFLSASIVELFKKTLLRQ